MIGSDQKDYQRELDRNYKRFTEKLQPLVNPQNVTITSFRYDIEDTYLLLEVNLFTCFSVPQNTGAQNQPRYVGESQINTIINHGLRCKSKS